MSNSTKKINGDQPKTPTDNNSPARTAAESRLWAALASHPGSTAAELAQHATAGKSTVGKILTRWASAGHVTRTAGASGDKRRAPDTWTVADTGAAVAPSTPAKAASTAADGTKPGRRARAADGKPRAATAATKNRSGNAESATNGNGGQRLPKGALRGMVEDFLAEPDRAGKDYTPGDIGRVLDRSAGAVSNCLDKLADAGVAEQTSDKPRRFRLSAAAVEG